MKILFKVIFFISLIINALNACAGKDKTACDSDATCSWDAGEAATCTAKENIMADECNAANDTTEACGAVVTTNNTKLCTFKAGAESAPNTCTVNTEDIATFCTAANADESTCKGVKSGSTELCTFTAAIPAQCITAPVTFAGDITIKLKSVKGKAVVITLEPAEADKDKTVTAETEIENLQLTSGSSFTKDLTCVIASGSKLGDVDCTMDTAATKDTKYKLAKSGEKVTFDGKDTFSGAVTVDDTEVTATEDTSPSGSPDNNSSSYMKISSFFTFLFLLF
jgi:hypothetical protein